MLRNRLNSGSGMSVWYHSSSLKTLCAYLQRMHFCRNTEGQVMRQLHELLCRWLFSGGARRSLGKRGPKPKHVEAPENETRPVLL